MTKTNITTRNGCSCVTLFSIGKCDGGFNAQKLIACSLYHCVTAGVKNIISGMRYVISFRWSLATRNLFSSLTELTSAIAASARTLEPRAIQSPNTGEVLLRNPGMRVRIRLSQGRFVLLKAITVSSPISSVARSCRNSTKQLFEIAIGPEFCCNKVKRRVSSTVPNFGQS